MGAHLIFFFRFISITPNFFQAATLKKIILDDTVKKFQVGTVFPHIVSSLEYFPPLYSFLTSVRKLFKFLLLKGNINEETI